MKKVIAAAALTAILIISLSVYLAFFAGRYETAPTAPSPTPIPTPTSTPTPKPQPSPPRFVLEVYGNANPDEVIDYNDLEYIKDIINGKANVTEFADANRDGIVDQTDLAQVSALLEGTASYIWILDGNGDPVKVRLPVNRIGAEYLSNAELMRILGVEDKVVAVDFAPYQLRHFYFPERADELINLGNMYKPDYEFVLSLNLDVLFTFSYDIAEKKEKLVGVDVVFLGLYWPDVMNVNESRFIQGIMKAGYILGKADKAREYINWLLALIDSVKGKTEELSESEKPLVLMTAMVEYLRNPQKQNMRTYTRRDPYHSVYACRR